MKKLILFFGVLFSFNALSGGGQGGILRVAEKERVFENLLLNTESLELKDGTILESDDIRRLLEARAALPPMVEPLPENIQFTFSE